MIVIVVGLVAVVLLVGLVAGATTRHPPLKIRDAAELRSWLEVELPDLDAVDIQLADDGHSALLSLEDRSIAIVVVIGDRLVARLLGGAQIRDIAAGPKGLRIRLRDLSLPLIDVHLSDGEAMKRWVDRMRMNVSESGGAGRA